MKSKQESVFRNNHIGYVKAAVERIVLKMKTWLELMRIPMSLIKLAGEIGSSLYIKQGKKKQIWNVFITHNYKHIEYENEYMR